MGNKSKTNGAKQPVKWMRHIGRKPQRHDVGRPKWRGLMPPAESSGVVVWPSATRGTFVRGAR